MDSEKTCTRPTDRLEVGRTVDVEKLTVYCLKIKKLLDASVKAVQERLQAHAVPVGLERHERLHLLLRQHDATVLGGTELGLGDAPVAVHIEQGKDVGGRRSLGSRGGGGVGHGWKRRGGRVSERE